MGSMLARAAMGIHDGGYHEYSCAKHETEGPIMSGTHEVTRMRSPVSWLGRNTRSRICIQKSDHIGYKYRRVSGLAIYMSVASVCQIHVRDRHGR